MLANQRQSDRADQRTAASTPGLQVQVDLRRPILRALVGRGLIERADSKEMLGYQHSGLRGARARQCLGRVAPLGDFD